MAAGNSGHFYYWMLMDGLDDLVDLERTERTDDPDDHKRHCILYNK